MAIPLPLSPLQKRLVDCTLLGIWLVSILFFAQYHEFWRDEVRALTIAISSQSWSELLATLHNEGHPPLWYAVLKTGHLLYPFPTVLKFASLTIAFLGVALFVLCSPFNLLTRLLFAFSFLPFYEYSIMARNYGLSFLLFFLFGTCYRLPAGPFFRRFLLAAILILAANSNIHATIICCCIAAYWFIDELWQRTAASETAETPNAKRSFLQNIFSLSFLWPFFLFLAGIIFCIWSVMPDKSSAVFQTSSLSIPQIFHTLAEALRNPGSSFDELFIGAPIWLRNLLYWTLIVGLLQQPVAAFFTLVGGTGLCMFFNLIYAGSLRHEGIYFMFVLLMYWLVKKKARAATVTGSGEAVDQDNLSFSGELLRRLNWFVCTIVLPAILAVHVAGAARYIYRDIKIEMTSAREFGTFLGEHPEYGQAIIIGEPDIRLESLPYYAANAIFLPRENAFKKYISLTTANRNDLTMGELLDCGRRLQEQTGREVLFALGHFELTVSNNPQHIQTRTESWNKRFSWNKDELEKFQSQTEKLTEFKRDLKNERYEIYRLKPKD